MTSKANNQPPDEPNGRTLPAPKRGGRRPGAGGKPGNLNALKHGRRSAQFAHLGLILATIPETRQALLHLGPAPEQNDGTRPLNGRTSNHQ